MLKQTVFPKLYPSTHHSRHAAGFKISCRAAVDGGDEHVSLQGCTHSVHNFSWCVAMVGGAAPSSQNRCSQAELSGAAGGGWGGEQRLAAARIAQLPKPATIDGEGLSVERRDCTSMHN